MTPKPNTDSGDEEQLSGGPIGASGAKERLPISSKLQTKKGLGDRLRGRMMQSHCLGR